MSHFSGRYTFGCECRFITCSVITFATVIAITKDLPDVEGDRKYGIETFSTRLGTRAVAFLGKPACYLKWSVYVVLLRKACMMALKYLKGLIHMHARLPLSAPLGAIRLAPVPLHALQAQACWQQITSQPLWWR